MDTNSLSISLISWLNFVTPDVTDLESCWISLCNWIITSYLPLRQKFSVGGSHRSVDKSSNFPETWRRVYWCKITHLSSGLFYPLSSQSQNSAMTALSFHATPLYRTQWKRTQQISPRRQSTLYQSKRRLTSQNLNLKNKDLLKRTNRLKDRVNITGVVACCIWYSSTNSYRGSKGNLRRFEDR